MCLENLSFRQRPARFVQRFEKSPRRAQRETLGNRMAFERFQGGLARVSVRARDAPKLRFAQLRGSDQGALDHLPARLESAQIILRKWFAGKINRRDGELRGIECAQ